jgi:hypothetical protein
VRFGGLAVGRAKHAKQLVNKGHSTKKVTDPHVVVVGWFLGGQKSARAGQFFPEIFYRVFELPSPRNAQKRDKKQIEKKTVWDFLVDFLVKTFRHDFLVKRFL